MAFKPVAKPQGAYCPLLDYVLHRMLSVAQYALLRHGVHNLNTFQCLLTQHPVPVSSIALILFVIMERRSTLSKIRF